MIYLDNIIFSLQKHGGVSVLWGKLIEHMSKYDIRYIEHNRGLFNEIRNKLEIPHNRIYSSSNIPINIYRYVNPSIKTKDNFIFHSSHYRISNNPKAKNITTVHDFTYEYYFSGLARRVHIWQKYNAIRNSDIIVCISENTRRDLLKFLPEIPKEKIRVIYNGVSEDYHKAEVKYPEFSDSILFVGGRQSYKNFSFALECAKRVHKKLLVVGGMLTPYEESMLKTKLGIDGYLNIVHPDNIMLNNIYNSVYCLLYPSLYEGFGIPVIEAQKAGCPVIAMKASSIPEIAGKEALLLESSSVENFKSLANKVNEDRQSIIEAGIENSNRFSWDKMTNEYEIIYNELFKK